MVTGRLVAEMGGQWQGGWRDDGEMENCWREGGVMEGWRGDREKRDDGGKGKRMEGW